MIPHCSRAFDHDFLCRQAGVKMQTRAHRAIDRLTPKGTNTWGGSGFLRSDPAPDQRIRRGSFSGPLAPVLSGRLSRSGRSRQFGLASAPIAVTPQVIAVWFNSLLGITHGQEINHFRP
jgi:hypothetical protein